MNRIKTNLAYRLRTDSHLSQKVFPEIKVCPFEGLGVICGLIPVRKLEIPDVVYFKAENNVLLDYDYLLNDLGWPIISKRMFKLINKIKKFPYRSIDISIIDNNMKDTSELYTQSEKPPMGNTNYIALQLLELTDAFDWENSEYERNEVKPNRVYYVSRLVLKEIDGGLPPLFRLSANPGSLFISNEAKVICEENGIRGAEFLTLDEVSKVGVL